jgi:hypothetical protein
MVTWDHQELVRNWRDCYVSKGHMGYLARCLTTLTPFLLTESRLRLCFTDIVNLDALGCQGVVEIEANNWFIFDTVTLT